MDKHALVQELGHLPFSLLQGSWIGGQCSPAGLQAAASLQLMPATQDAASGIWPHPDSTSVDHSQPFEEGSCAAGAQGRRWGTPTHTPLAVCQIQSLAAACTGTCP
jgi:hypothetical protein